MNPRLNLTIATVNTSRFTVALAEGYNKCILDDIAGQDGLRANSLIASQKPRRAAEELNRLGEVDQFKSVQLNGFGLIPPAGHERYLPIYEASEKAGLPVALHTATECKSVPQEFIWNQT